MAKKCDLKSSPRSGSSPTTTSSTMRREEMRPTWGAGGLGEMVRCKGDAGLRVSVMVQADVSVKVPEVREGRGLDGKLRVWLIGRAACRAPLQSTADFIGVGAAQVE